MLIICKSITCFIITCFYDHDNLSIIAQIKLKVSLQQKYMNSTFINFGIYAYFKILVKDQLDNM